MNIQEMRRGAEEGRVHEVLPLLVQAGREGHVEQTTLAALIHAVLDEHEKAAELLKNVQDVNLIEDVECLVEAGSAHLKIGHLKPAMVYLSEAVLRDRDHVMGNARLGMVLLALGRYAQALEPLRKACVAQPDIDGFRVNYSQALLKTGNIEEALEQLEEATSLPNPRSKILQQAKAEALMHANRTDEAIEEALIISQNKDASVNQVIAACRVLGGSMCHDEALRILEERLSEDEDNVCYLHLLAEFQELAGRTPLVVNIRKKLCELDEDNIIYLCEYGASLLQAHDPQEAKRQVSKARHLSEANANRHIIHVYNIEGQIYADLKEFDQAEEAFKKALVENENFIGAKMGLASLYMELGRLEEAEELYEDIGENAPAIAWSRMVQMGRVPDDPVLFERMEKMAHQPSLAGPVRTPLLYSLATAAQKQGKHEKAFELAFEANEVVKSQLRFNPEKRATEIDREIRTFSKKFMKERAGFGCDSTRLVFVCGMPRSGTTLVEQIIASHPDAFGAGELDVVPKMTRKIDAWEMKLGSNRSFPEACDDITSYEARKYGEQIVEDICKDAGDAKCVVDKLPHNFERIGLIKMLCPNAKIIFVRRDPRDIALSSYFIDFAARHGGLGYAYDLEWMGQEIAQCHKIMEHWLKVFGDDIMTLNYEDVVTDKDVWTRQIYEYIGLDTTQQTEEFHKLERPIKTASVWQVRQPIYNTSVAKWKPYENKLEPLMESYDNPLSSNDVLPAVNKVETGTFQKGMSALKNGNFEEAEAHFKGILNAYPRHAAAHHMIGASVLSQNNIDDAIQHMKTAVEILPIHRDWYLNLSKALVAAGKKEEAEKLLKQLDERFKLSGVVES